MSGWSGPPWWAAMIRAYSCPESLIVRTWLS